MIRIVDTYHQINKLFDDVNFNYSRWKVYINSIYDNSAHIFIDDVTAYIKSGKYSFEKDFLPMINVVYENPKSDVLHESFLVATNNLDQRIKKQFGKELNIDIVLYLGLGNAAGWVTKINDIDTVLLGVEKIIELNWHNIDSMYGLIYHELGHVYHAQYGVLEQKSDDSKRNLVWQLFAEGIAMYFEQALVGDFNYYHQNTNGWKEWCDNHITQIITDFDHDISTMTRFEQRYFGDWCNYHGYSDTGYYLGTEFVHNLIDAHKFDDLINLNIDRVYDLYLDFVHRKKLDVH